MHCQVHRLLLCLPADVARTCGAESVLLLTFDGCSLIRPKCGALWCQEHGVRLQPVLQGDAASPSTMF